VSKNLGDADERGIPIHAPRAIRRPRGRDVKTIWSPTAARERHGVEIFHRADAERRERLLQSELPLAVHRPLFRAVKRRAMSARDSGAAMRNFGMFSGESIVPICAGGGTLRESF